MISCFDERKATQLAARFLLQADSRMEYIRLIKLLYIADREALQNWGYPLTGDEYYSLKHGPIVSNVYDLVTADPNYVERSYWSTYIRTEGVHVILETEPPLDNISRAELKLVETIHDRYRSVSTWDLIAQMHREFKEWQDPGRSRIPITYEDILLAVGKSKDVAEELSDIAQQRNYIDKILNRTKQPS
jgi:uncharacterized phage-associated protein